MAEDHSHQQIVPPRRSKLARRGPSSVVSRTLSEKPAPPLHPGWTSHVSHKQVKALAACKDKLWGITESGVILWHRQGTRVFYTRYGSEHGLPGGGLKCLTLDHQGRPWVGGRAGLSYLDGTHWRTLPMKACHPSQNGCCDVLSITRSKDAANREELWVGTAGGLGRVLLAEETPHWQPYDLSDTPLPAPEIWAIAISTSGTLWLGTAWGLYRHEPTDSSWQRYTIANGLADNQVSHLLFGQEQHLWIGTAHGLCMFDGEQMIAYPEIDGAVGSIAIEPPTGHLWLVAAGTLWRKTDDSWHALDRSSEKKTLRAVATNERGNVWIGGKDGLVQQCFPQERDLSLPSHLNRPTHVNNLAVDKQGHLWVGTSTGLWEVEGRTWQHYRPEIELEDELREVEAIAFSPITNEMWIGSWIKGTLGGLRCITNGTEDFWAKKSAPPCAEALTFQPDGTLWVAAEGSIWSKRSKEGPTWNHPIETPLPNELVQALLVDRAGHLWCGSTGGLHYYKNGQWHGVLDKQEVHALVEDASGTLWIGTSNCLYSVLETTAQPHHITLPSKQILALAAHDETLWIGTSNGIARFQNKRVTVWEAHNSGLAHNTIRTIAIAISDSNTLWIGTANGISQFKPAEATAPNGDLIEFPNS